MTVLQRNFLLLWTMRWFFLFTSGSYPNNTTENQDHPRSTTSNPKQPATLRQQQTTTSFRGNLPLARLLIVQPSLEVMWGCSRGAAFEGSGPFFGGVGAVPHWPNHNVANICILPGQIEEIIGSEMTNMWLVAGSQWLNWQRYRKFITIVGENFKQWFIGG